MYVCMVCACVYACVCMCVWCVRAYMHVYACVYGVCVCVCMCMHVCVCTCMVCVLMSLISVNQSITSACSKSAIITTQFVGGSREAMMWARAKGLMPDDAGRWYMYRDRLVSTGYDSATHDTCTSRVTVTVKNGWCVEQRKCTHSTRYCLLLVASTLFYTLHLL